MKVAVLGAGVAGLVNARVLRALGVEVTVFEGRSDSGGVWSGSRGYPGLRTQNDKASYVFSDLSMTRDAAQHPPRAQVQAYLAEYARHHGVGHLVQTRSTATRATWTPERRQWRLTLQTPNGPVEHDADWLVVANGITSTPQGLHVAGQERFLGAGGAIVDASSLGDDVEFAGRRVVVVGAGKSGADVAVAGVVSGAASVAVVAHGIGWKLPYRVGRVSFQRLVNSRIGEHLLWAPWRTPTGRVLRRVDRGLRLRFQAQLARHLTQEQRLQERGLEPRSPVTSFTHLSTAGFFEGIDEGRIALHLGSRVRELDADEDGPVVVLDDGARLQADLLVLATGYDQDLSFFDEVTRAQLVDDEGQLTLLRHTLPLHVPQVAFAGWTNSFRSPLVSEIQALWIAAHIHGLVRPVRRRPQDLHAFQLTHERAARRGLPQFSSGTSIPDQDAWIAEAGLRLPWWVKVKELVVPVDPQDYARLHGQLQRRVAKARA